MEIPIPEVTADDVARIVRRDFPPEQFDAVIAVLNEYGNEESQHGSGRVRLAVLKLAEGDGEALRSWIDTAKCDYRDVLAYAEYPEYMTSVSPGVQEPDEKVKEVIKRDWLQYQRWLTETKNEQGAG